MCLLKTHINFVVSAEQLDSIPVQGCGDRWMVHSENNLHPVALLQHQQDGTETQLVKLPFWNFVPTSISFSIWFLSAATKGELHLILFQPPVKVNLDTTLNNYWSGGLSTVKISKPQWARWERVTRNQNDCCMVLCQLWSEVETSWHFSAQLVDNTLTLYVSCCSKSQCNIVVWETAGVALATAYSTEGLGQRLILFQTAWLWDELLVLSRKRK